MQGGRGVCEDRKKSVQSRKNYSLEDSALGRWTAANSMGHHLRRAMKCEYKLLRHEKNALNSNFVRTTIYTL